MKVLIVDDMQAARKNMIKALNNDGIEVVEAESGLEAIILFKNERPDVVCLDLDMPDLNGITALREIRAVDKDVKVIIVSAYNNEENIKETTEYGADHFLVKPYDLSKLVNIVKGA